MRHRFCDAGRMGMERDTARVQVVVDGIGVNAA